MEDFISSLGALGYESDDSGSEIDSEIQPILSDRGNISLLQEKIDKNIKRAVVLLGRIAIAFMLTVVFVAIVYLVSVFIDGWIPIYVLCLLLWLGYLMVFILIYKILKRVYKSIGMFNESKEFQSESVSKHIFIDGRFHIVLFLLGQIFWITTLAFTTLISEILILLNYYNLVVAYAFTLPLYISVAISLLTAFFSRLDSSFSFYTII